MRALSAGPAARNTADSMARRGGPVLPAGDTGEAGTCVRPSLPVALPVAGALWIAVLASQRAEVAEELGGMWFGLPPCGVLLLAGAAAVLAGAVACCADRRRRAVWGALAAAAVVGLAAGVWSTRATLETGRLLVGVEPSDCMAVVGSDPRVSSTGSRSFYADVDAPGISGRVWVDAGRGADRLPPMGSTVALAGRWVPLDLSSEFDASLACRGIAVRFRASDVRQEGWQSGLVGAVRRTRSSMLDVLDPFANEARALGCGVVCGMQAAMASFPVSGDFSRLGLSHLVAVSGTHLATVASLLVLCLSKARARPPVRLAILTIVLAAYVVFAGFQVSALRAWVMAVLALGGVVAGRRPHAITAVAVAAVAMVLANPPNAASMGLQLSVLSVVGLTVFGSLGKEWARCLLPRRAPDAVGEAFALTVVSQFCTLPVAVPAFGIVPLMSPVANAAVGPLVTGAMVAGLLGAPLAAAFPEAASVAMGPCDGLCAAACAVAHGLSAVPGTALRVNVSAGVLALLVGVGAVILYRTWPRARKRMALAALAAAAGAALLVFGLWRFGAPARIVVLDVGQGDAILVQDASHAVLVDTGPGEAVVDALARNHVLHLDAVVLTHTDLDHAGGLDDLVGEVGVGRVVVAEGVRGSVLRGDAELRRGLEALVGSEGVLEVGVGDNLQVGGFTLAVLWPVEPVRGDQNRDSLVLLASYGSDGGASSLTALLTGDAESDVVEALIGAGAVENVDVLKVGHHGSAASTTRTMAEELDPSVAVASAGKNNRYGHPRPECVELLEEGGALFLCTKDRGDVEIRPAREGIEVRCRQEAA